MPIKLILIMATVSWMFTGCSHTTKKPGLVSLQEFVVDCPRTQVFDRALAIAQQRNLEVKVLEKSSGLIRFERSALLPSDLDRYCVFPLVDDRDDLPIATYTSFVRDEGSAIGAVSLNFLATESSERSTKVSIRGNWTAILSGELGEYSGPVSSTGVLESELQDELAAQRTCGTTQHDKSGDKLGQLQRLRDEGLITEGEFETKRKALLPN